MTSVTHPWKKSGRNSMGGATYEAYIMDLYESGHLSRGYTNPAGDRDLRLPPKGIVMPVRLTAAFGDRDEVWLGRDVYVIHHKQGS